MRQLPRAFAHNARIGHHEESLRNCVPRWARCPQRLEREQAEARAAREENERAMMESRWHP
jgi:hypothetical protein